MEIPERVNLATYQMRHYGSANYHWKFEGIGKHWERSQYGGILLMRVLADAPQMLLVGSAGCLG